MSDTSRGSLKQDQVPLLLGEDREKSKASSQANATAPRLRVFRLTDDEGFDVGVAAISRAEATRRYNAEIAQLEGPVDVESIPLSREIRISWIDDKPEEQDVPEGGRIEPVPGFPRYLSVVATAAQWCAYYAKTGRDFFIMWEAE